MRIRAAAVRLALVLCAAPRALGKKVEVNEVVFDSAVADIQWFGEDRRTVLVQTHRGRLYRSTDTGNKWNDITDQLRDSRDSSGGAIAVDQIVKSKADPNTLLIAGSKQSHFLSTNAGETWRPIRQKATIHTFMFHKTRPKWALLSTWTDACEAKVEAKGDSEDQGPCNHMLYLTKDLGRTFTLVSSYVVQFSWGDVSHQQQDRVYFTHFRQKQGDQPSLRMWSDNVDFAYTDDGGKRVTRLVHKGNKFMVSHSFIFVAKLKEEKGQSVNLMISSDGGANFKVARLPQEIDERSYTVLDTSEGTIMLHVNHGSQEPLNVGNVYISDQEGVRYTLSLPNNVRGSAGNCEFDKVLGLEGVYMANFRDITRAGDADAKTSIVGKTVEATSEGEELEQSATGTAVEKRHSSRSKSKDESVIRTVISFDKGGVWGYLKPPKVDSLGKNIDCPPDRCWLHLHGVTNFQNYAPFYSVENAVGIMMGTGNVGPYLRFETDQTNTYLSRDGGLTWAEAHKGAFIYEFGDHGGLILMADDVRKTKQVVFTWNEGQSWYDFELGKEPIEVDNIVTEPNSTSTKFMLYGTRGDAGVLYHLDFDALEQPLCKGVWAADSVSSDYETWVPSDGRSSEKCLLGKQVTYTRRKRTSECFNGEKFERPVARKNCACTEENFECEMGFTRKVGSVDCKFADDGAVATPLTCTSSDFFYADAYRKVSGDSCEGGWQPKRVAVPCPANSRLSKGAVSVLGTIGMIGAIMAAVTFATRSERFKGVFANYGFDSFGNIRYSTIGGKTPENAMESVGARFDTDFDRDDFASDAPQLMAYTDSAGSPFRGDADEQRDAVRRIDTAAMQVPKLQMPPGPSVVGAADTDGGDDLL